MLRPHSRVSARNHGSLLREAFAVQIASLGVTSAFSDWTLRLMHNELTEMEVRKLKASHASVVSTYVIRALRLQSRRRLR
jgi:hypothetical protein